MITDAQKNALLLQVHSLLHEAARDNALQAVMEAIAHGLPHYHWVGVYFYDNGVLNLGPYVGAKTEHTLIAAGVGVCGTAVAENRNIIVDDVREVGNYLACSTETRAEIVVLIRDADGHILGQIDADGHQTGAFDASDEAFLEVVAQRLAPRMVEK